MTLTCRFLKLSGAVGRGTPEEGTELDFWNYIQNARMKLPCTPEQEKNELEHDPRFPNDSTKMRLKWKDGFAFCGPMKDNRRSNARAEPRNWLCIDVDGVKVPTGEYTVNDQGERKEISASRGITPGAVEWLKKELSQYCGCFYFTHSDEPNPTGYKTGYGRKVRFVVMMSKNLSPELWKRVSRNFGAELEKKYPDLAGCIDERSHEPSQLMYTCPKRNRDNFVRFNGSPLDPDKLRERKTQTKRDKKMTHRNYTAASQAAPADFTAIDPVIEALKEKGLYIGRNPTGPGKHNIICPFADKGEHEAGNVSSTVYFEPGADNEGVIHKYGIFHCSHDTCKDRNQKDFFAELGIDYDQYKAEIEQASQSPDSFTASGATYTTIGGIVRVTTFSKAGPSTRIVFPEIEIVGEAYKDDGNDSGKIIRFANKIGITFNLLVLDSDLTGKGDKVREALTAAGLKLQSTENRINRFLCDYIYFRPLKPLESNPELLPPTITWTEKAGWIKDCFIAGNEIIGPNKDSIFYQPSGNWRANYDKKGSLDAWRNTVARCARYSPPLMLALSAAFATPLMPWIDWLDQKSSGLHFYSGSSTGKTLTAEVAASVYGEPKTGSGRIVSWSGTANSLEKIAAAHNHSIICLDELRTANPYEVSSTIYRLANSTEKTRLDKEINVRPPLSWLILWISTGEMTTTQFIESVRNNKADAGTEVRSIQIYADMGVRIQDGAFTTLGIFESIPPGMKSSREASDTVRIIAQTNYGVAGAEWLKYLTENKNTLQDETASIAAQFDTELSKRPELGNLNSQQYRQLKTFKLCAVGGELATLAGLTGWDRGAAIDTSIKLFARTLDGKTKDTIEVQRLIEGFQKAAQEESHFSPWYYQDTKCDYGFIKFADRDKTKGVSYEVPKDEKLEETGGENPKYLLFYDRVFESLCKIGNFEPKNAVEELALRGIMLSEKGRKKKAHKVPTKNETKRFYTFDYEKLMSYGENS